MNKLRLLNELWDKAVMDTLTPSEIRLYLLLLANNGEREESEINFSVIKSALGEKFTIKMLTSVCDRLAVCGLLKISSLPPERPKNDDFTLTYKILSAKQG